ncbi:MAG TPA: tripartite tricarboxylate transporter substrate binding protein [Burkholderiales bacterium]|nr:tripartite tricarboxylate transporter substrate binding protein [Burkholderiales bacterium]
MRSVPFARLAAVAFAALVSLPAWAQYPARPIKLIVPIPPGGAPDISARVVGQRLSELLGQPVVVENRPGSNGNIAMDLVAKAPPDGYTLALLADSMIAINPHLYKKMQLDPLKDLAPVASVVSNSWVLSVNPSVPVKDFKEFIEYARRANPPLAYASGGNGSIHQMAMEMLKQRAGISLTHVPYKGGAPATTATVSGEVSAMFSGTSSAGQIRAGHLHALAVTGAERSKLFPDLPTIGEFYPGYEVKIWLGLFATAGTPEPVLARLHAEVNKALAEPEVKRRLNAAGGLEPYITTPAEFGALIRSDYDKYGKIVKDVGIKVD